LQGNITTKLLHSDSTFFILDVMNSPARYLRSSTTPQVRHSHFLWALPRIDASSPVDVWQNLLIATQPDQMIGRKRDILSVCQSLCLLSLRNFSFKCVASSVEGLGKQTQTASDDDSSYQVRTQNVDGTSSSFYHPSFFKINPLIPPSPRHPFILWLTRSHPPITSCSLHRLDASFPPAFCRFLGRRTPSMYIHPLYQPTAGLRPSSGPS
jgi:hypothetical protein